MTGNRIIKTKFVGLQDFRTSGEDTRRLRAQPSSPSTVEGELGWARNLRVSSPEVLKSWRPTNFVLIMRFPVIPEVLDYAPFYFQCPDGFLALLSQFLFKTGLQDFVFGGVGEIQDISSAVSGPLACCGLMPYRSYR